MKLVYLEWLDHSSFAHSYWKDRELLEELSPMLVKSVGWVVNQTEKTITIVSHAIEKNEQAAGEMCILKSAIKKKRVLKI